MLSGSRTLATIGLPARTRGFRRRLFEMNMRAMGGEAKISCEPVPPPVTRMRFP
jgi:hypothetical protein